MTKPRAYSYLRFSTPEQAKGDSYRRQLAMAQRYARHHGLELDEALTFHDVGVSAYRGANAEAGRLAYFVEAVQTGLVPQGSLLLVEQLDRISRLTPLRALDVLRAITDAGVTIVTLNDGKEYSKASLEAQPFDAMLSMMMFVRANEESASKAARIKASWDAKRASAEKKPMTSRVPAWLELDPATGEIIPRPERVEIVRRIFAMTLTGVGQHSIAATFNQEGVKTWGRGAHWQRSYIAKILGSSTVVGTLTPHVLEYDGSRKSRKALAPVEGYYPPVVSREVFAEVQALRTSGAASRGRHAARPVSNILAGLAKCVACGRTMTRTNKGKRSRPAFVCTAAKAGAGCVYRSVRYAWVEAAILERLATQLEHLPAASADEGLDRDIVNVEAWIDELKEGARGLLDRDTPAPAGGRMEALAAVKAEIREREAELADLIRTREVSSGPLIAARVAALKDALAAPLDAHVINLAMRRVFQRVTIIAEHRQLELQYIHGGDCVLGF